MLMRKCLFVTPAMPGIRCISKIPALAKADIRSHCAKIVCVGRNYAEHIAELDHQRPQRPFFFLKPLSAILFPGDGPIRRPKGVTLHYEVELGLLMGEWVRSRNKFNKSRALNLVESYFLTIDMTARNVQDEARRKGLPWDIAKGFDTFLPLSLPIEKDRIRDPHDARLWLSVNGQVRQSDNTNLMLFKIPELLDEISSVMTLEPGDIILTGTPKGVGPVKAGDTIKAGIEVGNRPIDEASIEFSVENSEGRYNFSEI